MLNHNAAENPTQEITLQYIVQRLRTLYHQDFTKRYICIYVSIGFSLIRMGY